MCQFRTGLPPTCTSCYDPDESGFFAREQSLTSEVRPLAPAGVRSRDEIRAVVLAGVAGAGKSTLGPLLARELDWPFFDTNDLHPSSNIEKMRRGIPLEDADRWPWLEKVRALIERVVGDGGTGVFECSALKEAYREFVIRGRPETRVVLLVVDPETARARVAARSGHYFPVGMLESQFETLEPIRYGIDVDASKDPEAVVELILARLGLRTRAQKEGESD